MPTMTFEEFQATGRDCADLGAALEDARWEGEPPARGRIYCDALYIERTTTPQWGHHNGYEWYLLIGRSDRFGELEDLEQRLYRFAVSEGYCDK